MSDLDLSALGLSADAGSAVVETAVAAEAASEASRAPRTEIKVNATKRARIAAVPEQERSGFGGGKRGSKYPFESLEAPDATGFDSFEVLLADTENADAKKLQGAIQAAVAKQNKDAKAEGLATYFVSRSIVEDGEYKGALVVRTDARPEKEEDEEAAPEGVEAE